MISYKYPDDTPVLVVVLDRGDVLYLWDVDESNNAWHQLQKDVLWEKVHPNGDIEKGTDKIVDMYLRFRSHTFGWLDRISKEDRDNIQGFFFRKGKGGLMIEKSLTGQWTQFVVGHVLNNKIHVTTLMVPAMSPMHTDVYDLSNDNIKDVIFNERPESIQRTESQTEITPVSRQSGKKASRKKQRRPS